MLTWKRFMMSILSLSILLTQGVQLPYLAYGMEEASHAPINGEVTFSWTTSDQVPVGATFNPYEGLQAIDADGDNVAVLVQVEGEVDTSREGVYSISYSIKNVDGQTFTAVRQVEVVAVSNSHEIGEMEEQLPNNEMNQNALTSLNDVEWILYHRESQQELIKLKLDVEKGQYLVQVIEDLQPLLLNEVEQTLNQEILKLRILSSKQVEKLAMTLTVRDLVEGIEQLNSLPYELGDQISFIPVAQEKTIAVVTGVIGGDISKEEVDYSGGVESEDLIHNVRFVLHETGVSTLYNAAPIIEGIEDTVVKSFETFDPKAGVTVKDDHDANLLPQLMTYVEQVSDRIKEITYQVTDSWGRTTEAVRYITEEVVPEPFINPLSGEETTGTSIENNIITVKGIDYTGIGDQRFKITFDARTKKIFVTEADNRTMNSRVDGDYFKLVLYNSKGEVKKSIILTGRDRANSSTLNELINQGWRYAIGDMISLWHYEPEQKISIAGPIINNGNEDFTQNVSKEMLRFHRFELTDAGLKMITNQAPTITLVEGSEKDIIVKRGEKVNLVEGLLISDDHDDSRLAIDISDYSTSTLGTQEIVITVTDTWGESTSYTRNLEVIPKNDIDGVEINVKNQLGETVFTFGFDELAKKLAVKNQSTKEIDPDNSSDVLIIRLYSKTGKIKRTIRIKGTDTGTSSVIEAFKNYKYSKDDYISIVPVSSSMISIQGTITNQPIDVDYANGTADLDYLANVRFQLTADGMFSYHYNQAPVINGVSAKTITRGEAFNPLEGIEVTDFEDGIINQSKVVVTYDKEALNRLGSTIVNYSVSDSWGRTTIAEREITVVAPNDLEYYQFHLRNNDEALVSISFDKLHNHLVVNDFVPNDYIEGNASDLVFSLTLFNPDHTEKGSVTLNYEQMITDSFIQEIEALQPKEGDYIKLWSPEHERIIFSYKKDPFQISTFDSEDRLMHTRFVVKENSLEAIYNEAPKIIGADSAKVVYGNPFDKMEGVSVEDNEKNLTLNVEGDIDTNVLGDQKLIYRVTDSYGREAVVERTVMVVPVYTTNEVQYYDENNNLRFAIGINEAATGFTYRLPQSNTNQSPSTISSVSEEAVLEPLFKFTVYDENGVSLKELIVTEQTDINEDLFNELTTLIVRPGYRFSVEGSDLTKLKVTGNLNKNEQSQPELTLVDYANLTDRDFDAVENVRFELTDNIVGVIYNQAPIITIQPTPLDSASGSVTLNADSLNTSTAIIRNKALSVEDYNLLEGVSVSDDKDQLTLTVENVEVSDSMLVHDLQESINTIGKTYKVIYKVTDSWGRESEPVERQVTIKSAMDDVNILFTHAANGLQPDIDKKAATLLFNMEAGRISVNQGNYDQFKYSLAVQYGAFSITKLSDDPQNPTFKYILGGANTYDKDTEFANAYNSNMVSNFKTKLEEVSVSYGDKIKIKMAQSPFVYINGEVINAQEDYSEGAKLGAVLADSYFVITPEGLRQEYSGEVLNDQNFSEIIWYSGVAGNKSFSLTLDVSDPNTMEIIGNSYDTEWIDTLIYSDVFRLAIKSSDGKDKLAATYTGRVKPTTVANAFNNASVVEGDYFVITHYRDDRLPNFKLYNLQPSYYFPEDIDYSKIITDKTYFHDVRFYITKQGIIPVYNAGPVFEGADEIDIIIGTEFDVKAGVKVTDVIDDQLGGLSLTYTVNPTTIDTTHIGTHTLTYTATDSWGRTTTHQRVVNVRPKLFDNKIQVFGSSNTDNPAFEIIFDNQKSAQSSDVLRNNSSINQRLGSLDVKSYSNESLDLSLATQDVFKIWIIDADGHEKKYVVLQGRDAANSDKLNALKEVDYSEGDMIKVWRHLGLNNELGQIQTLKITGTVNNESGSTTDYSTGFESIDQMNNTIFDISDEGLSARYNAAPQFQGLEDKILYYGDFFEPLVDVTVIDDKDTNLILTDKNVTTDFVLNRIGTYTATYTVTDSWGRTTSKTITIKVLSKVVNNTIDVYSENLTKAFTIGFNEEANRLVLTSDVIVRNSGASDLEMNLVIYNRFGSKKADISITSQESEAEVIKKLMELTQITMTNGDMISLSHTNPNLIKINGNVVNQTYDYQTGFPSTEFMSTVRFQVTNQGLKEIHASEYTIEITDPDIPLVIKRGEAYDLKQGVTVNHPNESIPLTQVMVENFDIRQIGNQTITYKVTDSWGKAATATREVIVEAKNELEHNKIHLMDESGRAQKFTIGFDAIEMKLTADLPSQSIISRIFRTLPQEGMVFEINVYNQTHELQNSFELTASDLNDSSELIRKIQNESIEYGYFIEVRAYNYDKGLRFDGIITMESTEEEQSRISDFIAMSKEEFITNARFELTEEGLVALYNEAPTIEGVEVQEIYVGEEESLLDKLTVTDDHDELDVENIDVLTDADFYEPGQYDVTYSITDSWGRTTSITSQIWVLSPLQKNEVTILSKDNSDWLFKLGFDSKSRKLNFIFNEDNLSSLDATKGDEEVMKLTIFNEAGKKLISYKLIGNDTIATIKEKFKLLMNANYQYHFGYLINIDIADESTQNIVIENVELDSEQIPDDAYQEYVMTDKDYFTNVRFELNPQIGLVATYNEAPILTNQGDQHLTYIKSLDVADYDLLANISITDDRDDLDETNIEILYNVNEEEVVNRESFNPKDPNNLHLGDNTVTLIGVDSWGRQSHPVELKLTLETAMNDIEIIFDVVDPKDNQEGGSGTVAMSIKFSMAERKVYAVVGPTMDANSRFKKLYNAYTIEILDKSDQRV